MDWQAWLKPCLVGMLTGGICVGGLQWGMKILLKTQADESLGRSQRTRNLTFAGLILAAQLLVALAILVKSGAAQQNPMALGLGLIGSTFALSLLGSRSA